MKNSKYGAIKYPFDTIPEGQSVVEAFSELKELSILSLETGLPEGVDNDFVMKYIILMYSNGSPAIVNYPHIGKRKSWVMQELGVKPNAEKKFERGYNLMLTNKNELVLQKIAAFLSLQKPHSWQTWMKAEEQLYMVNGMAYPKEDKDANERIKLINSLNEQIDLHKKKILEYEDSVIVETALDTFMAYQTLGIRPEEVILQGALITKPSDAKADTIFPEVGN